MEPRDFRAIFPYLPSKYTKYCYVPRDARGSRLEWTLIEQSEQRAMATKKEGYISGNGQSFNGWIAAAYIAFMPFVSLAIKGETIKKKNQRYQRTRREWSSVHCCSQDFTIPNDKEKKKKSHHDMEGKGRKFQIVGVLITGRHLCYVSKTWSRVVGADRARHRNPARAGDESTYYRFKSRAILPWSTNCQYVISNHQK